MAREVHGERERKRGHEALLCGVAAGPPAPRAGCPQRVPSLRDHAPSPGPIGRSRDRSKHRLEAPAAPRRSSARSLGRSLEAFPVTAPRTCCWGYGSGERHFPTRGHRPVLWMHLGGRPVLCEKRSLAGRDAQSDTGPHGGQARVPLPLAQ